MMGRVGLAALYIATRPSGCRQTLRERERQREREREGERERENWGVQDVVVASALEGLFPPLLSSFLLLPPPRLNPGD